MENLGKEVSKMRQEYALKVLDEKKLKEKPIEQFELWLKEAINSEVLEANAMTLATADSSAKPSLRVVLLKGIEEENFIFYTNYLSQKAQEMEENPQVCLNFFWIELQRQVRIEGMIEKVSEQVATEYFHSRPKGSQLGAWASQQSSIIANRDILERKIKELEQEYLGDKKIPKPEYWGGYKVIPHYFEFWQGRPNRLHDRMCYALETDNSWKIARLSP